MATGDSADVLARMQRLLPAGWFASVAPNRDAVIGAISDVLSWCYSLIVWAAAQTRLVTSSAPLLDLWSYDYLGLTTVRRTGEADAAFASRVKMEVTRERVTRSGMIKALTDLTGNVPIIIEPFLAGDCGAWSSRTLGVYYGCWGWSQGNAADIARAGLGAFAIGESPIGDEVGQATGYSTSWGSRVPAQVWITVFRPGAAGIPNIGGWARRTPVVNTPGGWSSRLLSTLYGGLSIVSRSEITGAVTDQDIYDCINRTKPLGVTVWVQLI